MVRGYATPSAAEVGRPDRLRDLVGTDLAGAVGAGRTAGTPPLCRSIDALVTRRVTTPPGDRPVNRKSL
jgi:hypothetical protein